MKVLFDTNVHVSDAIHAGGATRAITATLKARWKIFVCPTILAELERVIRTKFNRSQSFAFFTTALRFRLVEDTPPARGLARQPPTSGHPRI